MLRPLPKYMIDIVSSFVFNLYSQSAFPISPIIIILNSPIEGNRKITLNNKAVVYSAYCRYHLMDPLHGGRCCAFKNMRCLILDQFNWWCLINKLFNFESMGVLRLLIL